MQIINKGVVARVDSQKEVFTKNARDILYKEYKGRERLLSGEKANAMLGGGTYTPLDRVQDVGMLRKNMNQYKKDYERGAPVALPTAMRNYLWKRAKQLKDEFTIGMLPKSHLHPVKHRQVVKNGQLVTAVVADKDKVREYKSIERQQAWQKKNSKKVTEFKNIMRQLEPDNPELSNVERFRRS